MRKDFLVTHTRDAFDSTRCTRVGECPNAERRFYLIVSRWKQQQLIMRRLLERLRVWGIGRPECINPIGECAPLCCQRVDLSLLRQDGLTELLQRAFEVGEFDLDGFDSCGIIHEEIISA
jgi:hypothetical protein